MSNLEAQAQRFARAETAFKRHVIEKVSLRDLSPEMGVSPTTLRQDVKVYQSFLAKSKPEDIEERRAATMAEIHATRERCLYIYEKYKNSKPMVAIGALNTYAATFTHQRAIEGLDAPKQVQAEQDITYHVLWSDDDSQPASTATRGVAIDPSHADPFFTTG